MKKSKILVACRDPGGAEALSPVVLRLMREGRVELTALGYKFSEEIFKKRNIHFKKLEDFNISDVSPASMELLLDKLNPNLVVLGTSQGRSIENDIVLAARKKQIRTFCLLDFWNNYSQRFSCLETGKKFLFLPDFIGIMDELAKEEMIGEGFDPGRLLITGQPYFDSLFELARDFNDDKIRRFRNHLNLLEGNLLISFFSQALTKTRGTDQTSSAYLGYTQITILDSLIKALHFIQSECKRDIALFIKLHPKESSEEVDRLISGAQLRIIMDKGINPRELMLSSDVVSGMFTMVLVEAFLVKKKVLSIQIGLKKEDELILSRKKVIQPVYREENLLPALRECLLTDNYNYDKQFKIYTDSTTRVVETIYNLLQSQ